MKHVFISYSRRNILITAQFYNALIDAGYPVWIDKQGIEASDDWVERIDSALHNAGAVLWIASEASLKSPVVRSELIMAQNLEVDIVPARIEETQQSILLSTRHYVDFVGEDFDVAIQQVIAKLNHIPALQTSEAVKQNEHISLLPTDIITDLQDKIDQLDGTTQVICIGAVYADVYIPDTRQHPLGDGEMIIDSIKRQVGGSTWKIANRLNETRLNGRVHLLTAIGDKSVDTDDSDAHFVGNRLQQSGLMVTDEGEGIWWFKGESTATTFIFEGKQRPMLTSPGVISRFDWDMVHRQINHNTEINFDNNIVYIGGYFKSALYTHIGDMLRELDKENCIVYMDPGRFTWVNPFTIDPEADHDASIQVERQRALRDYLHYLDIYSATESEFRSMFMDVFQSLGHFNCLQALQHLQRQPIKLPEVMIIRDKTRGKVYINLDNQQVNTESDNRYMQSSSLFDARMIQYIATQHHKRRQTSLASFISQGVRFALDIHD